MKTQAYGQYCGLARAAEVIGEPWALLIIRDLIVAPKGFAELHEGLPGIHMSILSARLEELEQAGVIRRLVPSTGDPVAFELTEYGSELEDVVLRLGRWGAKTLGGPRRDETVTPDSMVMALRTMFRPEMAQHVQIGYQLNLGQMTIHALVNDGTVEVGKGPIPDADLVMEAGPVLKALVAGEMSPREAIESGGVRLSGDPRLLDWFVELFHITPAPPGHPSLSGLMNGMTSMQRRNVTAEASERLARQSLASAGNGTWNGGSPNGHPPAISAH
jgi:DNA-binding HxlR family transcriptional regulator